MTVYMVVAVGGAEPLPISIHLTLDGANSAASALERRENQFSYWAEAWEVEQ